MLLAEVLKRKEDLEDKINSLKDYLGCLASSDDQEIEKIDAVVSKIYTLFDELQQVVFTINRANSSIEVKIGSSKTSLEAAIKLRKTIEQKINILSDLIDKCKHNKNNQFSISDLLENKDRLLAEYNILTAAIKSKDWSVELKD